MQNHLAAVVHYFAVEQNHRLVADTGYFAVVQAPIEAVQQVQLAAVVHNYLAGFDYFVNSRLVGYLDYLDNHCFAGHLDCLGNRHHFAGLHREHLAFAFDL